MHFIHEVYASMCVCVFPSVLHLRETCEKNCVVYICAAEIDDLDIQILVEVLLKNSEFNDA